MTGTAIEYFELPELPGRKFFACGPLRATIATDVCAGNWRASNESGAGGRLHCRRCPFGARHAGLADANLSLLRGTKTCARCHALAPRLIKKHMCVSCANREYEAVKGRNCKGTAPTKLTAEMLARRSVSYLAGGELKTRVVERALDQDELIVAVLRDEPKAVRFAFRAPKRMQKFVDGICDGTKNALNAEGQ